MKKKAELLIRKLVPELQELKKGCVVEGFTGNGIIEVVTSKDIILRWDADTLVNIPLDEFDEDCVIGSEIHLEHVIMAFDNFREVYYHRTEHGIHFRDSYTDCGARYDCRKLFVEQSEEFYEFIVETLK